MTLKGVMSHTLTLIVQKNYVEVTQFCFTKLGKTWLKDSQIP